MQKATAATGFLRNWSKLTGIGEGFIFGAVISEMVGLQLQILLAFQGLA